ncbi:MAG: MiaB/RimO family radical SAM methylthiotransferase [Acetobacteraceae bacterium]
MAPTGGNDPSQIITFGCRLNLHESEEMARLGAGQGKMIVVNSCAVTTSAERQARQAIRKIHHAHPDADIIVTGCASEIAPDAYRALPGVTRIVPNRDKLQAAQWASAPVKNDFPEVPGQHIRAFLQVQQGCDHQCTFCIIPHGRGASRSFPVEEVIVKARSLIAAGHQELVVTGVDIASWGVDLLGRPALGTLCRAVLREVPELRRLRLSSVDPAAFDDDLWTLIAEEPRLLPHLHLSLEAASNLVLKRMKRRHSREDALHLVKRARDLRPDMAFGADLIAGFPTETAAQAQETYDFVAECEIAYIHAFPYSERPGTPAARMPPVPHPQRTARAARLRERGEANRRAYWTRLIGQETEILMEKDGIGRSPHFAPVKIVSQQAQRGEIITVRLVALDNEAIVAEIEAHG